MDEVLAAKRQFEDRYYGLVGSKKEVGKAIRLRNDGWNTFKATEGSEGLGDLKSSVDMLIDLGPQRREFGREMYASWARYAMALCVRGKMSEAQVFAMDAFNLSPQGFFPEQSTGGLHDGVVYPDQFLIDFGPIITAIFATNSGDMNVRVARSFAENAAKIAELSQDPDRVIFADRDMSDTERAEARSADVALAKLVIAAVELPERVQGVEVPTLSLTREGFARYVCAAA